MPDGIRVIAVDFDGCLCANCWPEIGKAHANVIAAAKTEKETGTKLILWTCRVGPLLEAAVAWCAGHGLVFDAVNEQVPELKNRYGSDSRKVFADEYWDDRAVRKPDE